MVLCFGDTLRQTRLSVHCFYKDHRLPGAVEHRTLLVTIYLEPCCKTDPFMSCLHLHNNPRILPATRLAAMNSSRIPSNSQPVCSLEN